MMMMMMMMMMMTTDNSSRGVHYMNVGMVAVLARVRLTPLGSNPCTLQYNANQCYSFRTKPLHTALQCKSKPLHNILLDCKSMQCNAMILNLGSKLLQNAIKCRSMLGIKPLHAANSAMQWATTYSIIMMK